jgi:hypothetical protein
MKPFKFIKLGLPVCAGIAFTLLQFGFAGEALAASDCPHVTVAESKGVAAGKFPQQYDLAEFESRQIPTSGI